METNQIRARKLCAALSCPQPAKFTCSGCSGTRYCSKKCQTSDWPLAHKFKCAPSEVTTADFLLQACLVDHHPWDENTLVDYGFRRSWTAEHHTRLMDLYKELLVGQGVRRKTLHRWLTRGVLAEEIDKTFHAIPTELHGPGYTWFSQNRWVLEGRREMCPVHTPRQSYTHDEGWLRRAFQPYRGHSETAKLYMDQVFPKMTSEEQDCVEFTTFVTESVSFCSPSVEMWVRFGFCTLRTSDGTDGFELRTLSSFYFQLLMLSTFEEFLEAYKSSELFKFFASKGLADELRRTHPLIEDVLKPSPNPGLSVWYLKVFALYDGEIPLYYPPYLETIQDFGFLNCTTGDELLELKAAYRTLFRHTNCPPLELYKAMMEGKLFKFVTKWVKLADKKKFKRIMVRNLNPPNMCGSPLILYMYVDVCD